MDAPAQTALLVRTRIRCLQAKAKAAFSRFPLTFLIMVVLLLGYFVVGYWLMDKGLGYAHRLPQVGDILAERILALLFMLFFVMLVFSNSVLLFLSLFRSKETQWMLTLPISHKALFALRILEGLVVSSWGLIMLSSPILLAYGGLKDADWTFYLKSFGLLTCFIAIPACLSGVLVALLVRYLPLSRRALLGLGALVLGAFVYYAYQKVGAVTDIRMLQAGSEITAFTDALRYTEMSVNPWLPSAWMTDSVADWAGLQEGNSIFSSLLLISWSAMAFLVAIQWGGGLFYPAWSRSVARAARGVWRRSQKGIGKEKLILGKAPTRGFFSALTWKDLKLFFRDPSQWTQCFVVISLLLVYVLNIRNLGYNYESVKWLTVITYLNFSVSGLALSTLTTRFVFPQFSLEGQRLWVVGSAPMKLTTVLWQKFLVSFLATTLVTSTLMIVSGTMLRLPFEQALYFVLGMLFLALGLTSLSVGLGTLVPDFKETNPAKMVSGLGGTLCLVGSFVIIVVSVLLLAAPDILALIKGVKEGQEEVTLAGRGRWKWFGAYACLILSMAAVLLWLATRKIKRLDF